MFLLRCNVRSQRFSFHIAFWKLEQWAEGRFCWEDIWNGACNARFSVSLPRETRRYAQGASKRAHTRQKSTGACLQRLAEKSSQELQYVQYCIVDIQLSPQPLPDRLVINCV